MRIVELTKETKDNILENLSALEDKDNTKFEKCKRE